MMLRQFTRYVGVQLVAYAIDMGVFLALGLALTPLWANVGGKLAAGGFAFVVHRRLTFAGHVHGPPGPQLLRYALLLAANVPLSSLLLWLLMPLVQPVVLAKIGADVASVALTFVLSRQLVFRAARPSGDPTA
jgi:putative flippase GtrA